MIISAVYNRKADYHTDHHATEAYGIDITKYQEIQLRPIELATVLQRAGHVTICHNSKEVADALASLRYNAARVFLCHQIEKADEPIYHLVIEDPVTPKGDRVFRFFVPREQVVVIQDITQVALANKLAGGHGCN